MKKLYPSQRGQALTEYALIVSVVSALLFVPTPLLPHPVTGENLSVTGAFIAAFDVYLDSFHRVVALPFP